MIDADRKRFATALHGMASLYGKDLTVESVELWWVSLSDWAIGEFETAAALLLKQCEFMPKPFDFESLRKEESKPSAANAWDQAIRYVTTGPWRQGPHPNPLIEKSVNECGGWNRLAMQSLEANERWTRREFCAAFDQFADSQTAKLELKPEETNQDNLAHLGGLISDVVKDPA